MPKFLDVTDTGLAMEKLGASNYSVTNYGAVGNGTTDDTTAIHAARTAAGVGGTVFFPPGTYLVSGLTASVVGQTWELAAGATVKAASGAANILAITADDVMVTGGVFDGANQAPSSDWARKGIFVNAADGVTIRNVEIVDSPSHAVYGAICNRLTVADCRMTEFNQSCVLVQNYEADTTKYDIVITGNHAESSIDGAQGIGVLGGIAVATPNMFVERVTVTNNTVILLIDPALETACIGLVGCIQSVVSGNILVGSLLGITFPKPIKAVISDNQVRQFSGAGIEIPGNITDCVVSGNVIDAAGVTSTVYGSALVGIWNSGVGGAVVKGLSIVGNAISGMTGDVTGIAVGFGTSTESVSITGNVIRGGTCNKYIGIGVIGLAKNVTISGNTFDAGTVATAIRSVEFRNSGADTTSTVSDVAVTNNIFTSTSSASGSDYSISFSNSITGLAVTGNVFKAPSSAGYAALYSIVSASNVAFTGNTVNAGTSTFSSAIEVYGAVNGMSVSGNQLTNLNQAVVRLLTSTAVTVENINMAGNNLVSVANRIKNSTSGSAIVASSVFSTDNYTPGVTSTATAAATTTLTLSSTEVQVFTGSTTQTCTLATTSIPAGHKFTVVNNSTGVVTVTASGGASIGTLATGASGTFTALQATPTTAAHWSYNLAKFTQASVLDTNGNIALGITPTASAVNYLTVRNRAAGTGPSLEATGADTDIAISVSPKGSALLYLANSAQVSNATSAVNYIRITGGTTGNGATMLANGTDTNVDMLLTTRGAGIVRANGVPVTTNATTATHTAQQIELGHATDTTVSRTSAGQIAVEGNPVGIKVAVPASAGATGVVGQWAAESGWLYICTATNTWQRVAIATWP
jgi:hypothetical protein